MTETIVDHDGIELWAESFGDPSAPTVLLIMGAGAQGIRWELGFCERLVAGGVRVIRYDHRDTGASTVVDVEAAPYGIPDLADDARAILAAHGVERAHVVGASMGGIIGQELALTTPALLASLTLLMSTPTGAEVAGASVTGGGPVSTVDLPGPRPDVLDALVAAVAGAGEGRSGAIASHLATSRAIAGTLVPFDEDAVAALTELEYDRARDWTAKEHHGLAVASYPSRLGRLDHITVPTLVVHGTEDPILPFEHGEALAAGIPAAELVLVPGLGHELPAAAWPVVADAILEQVKEHS